MCKIIGITMIISAGTLSGILISKKITSRILFFEQFLIFITELKEKLSYTLSSASEILYSDQKMITNMLSVLVKNLEKSGMRVSAKAAVESLPSGYGLSAADKKLIYDFFSSFGSSDCDSQLSHCELYLSLIRQLLLSQREESAKKSKLMRLLGTFCGMGVGLFFL